MIRNRQVTRDGLAGRYFFFQSVMTKKMLTSENTVVEEREKEFFPFNSKNSLDC